MPPSLPASACMSQQCRCRALHPGARHKELLMKLNIMVIKKGLPRAAVRRGTIFFGIHWLARRAGMANVHRRFTSDVLEKRQILLPAARLYRNSFGRSACVERALCGLPDDLSWSVWQTSPTAWRVSSCRQGDRRHKKIALHAAR